MRQIRKTDRPRFVMAQPGSNTRWTTEGGRLGPQEAYIQQSKRKYLKTLTDQKNADLEAAHAQTAAQKLPGSESLMMPITPEASTSDHFGTDVLQELNDEALSELVGAAVSDRELEAVDLEMDRRNWSKKPWDGR